jgi:hypothetical protein
MRRVTVAAAFALVVLASAIASAMIPYFGSTSALSDPRSVNRSR